MVSESDITAHSKTEWQLKCLVKSLNKEVSGKVSEVSMFCKKYRRTIFSESNFNKQKILSGMFVNVQFPILKKQKQLQSR
jgi:hypothetical protein